eukprot:jgi/Undpi1/5474/HiC_scaffold_2.g00753.m1
MSVVTVQVGQCGNQLGASLFDALYEHAYPPTSKPTVDGIIADAAAACRRTFFRDGGVARAVIIDTEPKVIQQIVASRGGGRVGVGGGGVEGGGGRRGRGGAREWGEEGAGEGAGGAEGGWRGGRGGGGRGRGGAANNWAYGYYTHGAAFSEACLEAVRRETERCDRLAGLCVLHSLAGGTGSGLGTYLTEALRDDLPSAFVLNAAVCAHSSGEVILQNYNTMFTLSKLAKCSDGVLVVENETATAVCQKLLRIERPSHADLNKIISNSLVAALIPATTTAATTNTDTNAAAAAAAASNASPMGGIGSSDGGGAWGGGGSGGEILHLGDKLAHLCPNRDFMFLQASMVPQIPDRSRDFTINTWEALVGRAHQMHITGAVADIGLDWRKKARDGAGAGES